MNGRHDTDAQGRPLPGFEVPASAGDALELAETARMARPVYPYGEQAAKAATPAKAATSVKKQSPLDRMRALSEDISRRKAGESKD